MDLTQHGIEVKDISRNSPVSQLYADAVRHEERTTIANSGALVAYSGDKTGRSPKDKRVVQVPGSDSERDIWWGDANIPLEPDSFTVNLERARDYLNIQKHLYVVDAFAGWDPQHRIKVRVICSRPYHALFIYTMLIRPTKEELASFGDPDVVIYNAGQFPANRHTKGMTSKTSVDLNLESGEAVILGTEYAGEMKKGVFTIMNYMMPAQGVLSMHCSATAHPDNDSSTLLFGLSGTGKTTLSADPHRHLIGDDEHCWTDTGVFNIEGGCYAKAIDLTHESEPDIFEAIRFGSVLENVVIHEEDHNVDFHDASITQNTRGAYPIEFIKNARIPCIAGHPTNIIFLTCDAFGVLPPISKLNAAQAMYHFISGYTAKVAGTEVGVKDPQTTFSPCFGGPFLAWHPGKYAELLAQKMSQHNANVWLINTGWIGGAHGVGSRIKLKYTRAMIDAIHDGTLDNAPTQTDPVFGIQTITKCPNVPDEALLPELSWEDKDAYHATAKKLAGLFRDNFTKYEAGVSQDVRDAGPKA